MRLLAACFCAVTVAAASPQPKNIIYVSKSGNDRTAVPYKRAKPFLTIPAAVSAGRPGDIVQVDDGVYGDGDIQLKDRMTLRGSGWKTVMARGSTIYTSRSHVLPAHDNLVEDICIAAYPDSVFVNPIGCTESAGELAWSGLKLRAVWLWGIEDCLHVVHTVPTDTDAENCRFESRWDTVALAFANHLFTARNCTLTSTYGTFQNSSATQRCMFLYNGTVRLVDCFVNTSAGEFWPVAYGAEVYSTRGAVLIVERTSFNTIGNPWQSLDVVYR